MAECLDVELELDEKKRFKITKLPRPAQKRGLLVKPFFLTYGWSGIGSEEVWFPRQEVQKSLRGRGGNAFLRGITVTEKLGVSEAIEPDRAQLALRRFLTTVRGKKSRLPLLSEIYADAEGNELKVAAILEKYNYKQESMLFKMSVKIELGMKDVDFDLRVYYKDIGVPDIMEAMPKVL